MRLKFRKGFAFLAVLVLGACIFSPSGPPPSYLKETQLDQVLTTPRNPDRIVELFEPILDSSLATGSQSSLSRYPAVQVQHYQTHEVVEYRMTSRRYGFWNPQLEFQWNLFLLRSYYLHAETVSDTAGMAQNTDSLYAKAKAVDRFTHYIDSASAKAFFDAVFTTRHKAIGIQIRATDRDDSVLVHLVAPNSPAEIAGLRRGMALLAINDSSIMGDSALERFIKFVNADTSAPSLKIAFAANGQRREAVVARAYVDFPTVLADSVGSVGYIAVGSFVETTVGGGSTYSEFVSALKATRRFEKTVLDLRGNGGGVLSEALKMCDEVLSKGVMIRQLQRRVVRGAPVHYRVDYSAKTGGSGEGRKFVLLADSTTASAAEVLLAAMQEGLGAPYLGGHSYGKAIGQIVVLSPGQGYALITQLRHTTAAGLEYQGIGLNPTHPSNALPYAMLAEALALAGAAPKAALDQSIPRKALELDWNRSQAAK